MRLLNRDCECIVKLGQPACIYERAKKMVVVWGKTHCFKSRPSHVLNCGFSSTSWLGYRDKRVRRRGEDEAIWNELQPFVQISPKGSPGYVRMLTLAFNQFLFFPEDKTNFRRL